MAQNSKINNLPSARTTKIQRDLSLMKVDPNLESAVLGLRRKLTLKKFLSMELSKPMFTPGSVQATARTEMMKLPGLNGTKEEASKVIRSAIINSKLYSSSGYWIAHRCYFSVFGVFLALLAAQERNDKIIRDLKQPRAKKGRERNAAKLVEAKIVRLNRWIKEKREKAILIRQKISKLLKRAKELNAIVASHKAEIALLKEEVA